jgi:hypothetical protein
MDFAALPQVLSNQKKDLDALAELEAQRDEQGRR